MNFNQQNLSFHLQQQLHMQMLQQQQQQQVQQHQQPLSHPTGVSSGMNIPNSNNLTLQQQQLIANQRLASAMKQQAQQQQLQHHQLQAQQHEQKVGGSMTRPSPQLGQQSSLQQQHIPAQPQAQAQLNSSSVTKPLPSLNYWSTKLENPSTDVLLYEQIISRDLVNKELTENSNAYNKELLTKLYKNLKFFNDLKMARMKTIQYANQGQYTNSIWGEGYQGYGNGFTDGPTRVLTPNERKKPTRLRDIPMPKAALDKQAYIKDDLIPIRLDFEAERDKFRLRDTLLWNQNDHTITLENLVSVIMEDYKFNNPLLGDTVLASIKEQVDDYHKHVYNSPYGDDLRVLIKLDITVSNNQLIDQFEWDISNPENSPEEFAQSLCEELSLPGEFATAIAHSIREQSQIFTKSLYLSGYDFKGGFIDEDEIRNHLRAIVTHHDYLRPKQQLPQFTPQLLEISNPDLERLDKIRERDSRRKRRQGRTGRRGGPTLPDLSDVPRTFRTPAPSSVLPGGLDFTDSVDSYVEYVETISKPVEQARASDEAKEPTPQRPQQTNGLPQSARSTPRNYGRTIRNQKVTYSHDKGSRLLVKIRL